MRPTQSQNDYVLIANLIKLNNNFHLFFVISGTLTERYATL